MSTNLLIQMDSDTAWYGRRYLQENGIPFPTNCMYWTRGRCWKGGFCIGRADCDRYKKKGGRDD